ncbi:MAG: protein-L-isoaspartate O-methyltransferase family protein [Steroidobacteraceae bacterium]
METSVDREVALAIVRQAYAKQTMCLADVVDPRIGAAFAEVRREDFLGPGPWQMLRAPGLYSPTPEADPVYVYIDRAMGLVPERNINNGQPSLHAMLLKAAGIKEGEHVVHVGAGTGYYSAIMSVLAGPNGTVTAIECNPELAARARSCLAGISNTRLLEGNGASAHFGTANVIYVNAGVTHPADAWLDNLAEGGRLLLPLSTDENMPSAGPAPPGGAASASFKKAWFDPRKAMRTGAYFLIRRTKGTFDARKLLPMAIIPAEGVRTEAAEAALAAAFERDDGSSVTHLIRGKSVPDEKCWLPGEGWCLTSD